MKAKCSETLTEDGHGRHALQARKTRTAARRPWYPRRRLTEATRSSRRPSDPRGGIAMPLTRLGSWHLPGSAALVAPLWGTHAVVERQM